MLLFGNIKKECRHETMPDGKLKNELKDRLKSEAESTLKIEEEERRKDEAELRRICLGASKKNGDKITEDGKLIIRI